MVTRLKRVVRHRLLLLLALVLLGTAGAVFLTGYLNNGIRPTFEGVAVASLPAADEDTGSGRGSTEIEPSLADALEAAIDANQGFLDGNHAIRAASAIQSIQFIVTGRTPEEATTEASDMRDRYLVATAPAPVEARMEEVLAKAHVVRQELNILLPEAEVIPSDPLVAAQRALLNGQISSLTSESAQLSVEQVLADTDDEKADIQEDIDRILAQIVEVRTQLAALPADSTEDARGSGTTAATGDTGDRGSDPVVVDSNAALDSQFQIESLQSLYSSLQIEFQQLYIESTNGGPAQLPEVDVTDETPDPIPTPLAAGTGLFGFTLLGLGLIVVDDRLRPKWWTQRDVSGVLAETPDRRVSAVEPWYWNTPTGPRKLAIQKVAVSLLPGVEGGPVAVGVVGLTTKPTALRAFSVDLAATMVTTGRSSLVIDTTGLEEEVGAEPWQLRDGAVVADLLNPLKNDIDDTQIARAVVEAGKLWPGLGVIPSGGPSLYSIEGAMTPLSGRLLDHSRKAYDLTLVPITERGTALSDALIRNLDAVLIVGRGGRTRIKDVESLTERLRASGSRVLGSVLVLRPTRRKLRELFRGRKGKSDVRTDPAISPAPAVRRSVRNFVRPGLFGRHRISKVLDRYSISDSWRGAQNGGAHNHAAEPREVMKDREVVNVRAGIDDDNDPVIDLSSKAGNGSRPSIKAILASHPDARRRSEIDQAAETGDVSSERPAALSMPES